MKPSHTMVNVDFHVSNGFCYSGLSMANLDSGMSSIHVFLSTSTMAFLWRATQKASRGILRSGTSYCHTPFSFS